MLGVFLFMDSFLLSDDLHFRLQRDPALLLRRGFHPLDQRQHIRGARAAIVHDEISMHFGNLRPANVRAFEAEFIDEWKSFPTKTSSAPQD